MKRSLRSWLWRVPFDEQVDEEEIASTSRYEPASWSSAAGVARLARESHRGAEIGVNEEPWS